MAVTPELIGESPVLVSLCAQVERLLDLQGGARRLPPILLQGETGTGKGLLARAIHAHGARATGPFVNVDCAAIPDTLLEAELFGFERSAFTDARRSKPGLLHEAHGGVLFLDEIATLSLPLQAKLLKTIDERTVRRLGSTKSEAVDVWVVAAAAEPLATAVRDGRFRADLYHRLSGLVFEMPALRTRGDDILLLAEHFLARACADYGVPAKMLTADAAAALRAHRWPGNVRELSNVMERVALLWPETTVTGAAVRNAIGPAAMDGSPAPAVGTTMLRESLETFERDRLVQALEATGWNVTRAAERLGVPRNTLRYRIEKHDVRPPRPRRAGGRRTSTTPTDRRPIWLLRVALNGTSEHPAVAGKVVKRLSEKVASFGGHVARADVTGVAGVFGLEPAEDAPSRAAHAALASMRAIEAIRNEPSSRFVARAAIAVASLGVHRGRGAQGVIPRDWAAALPPLETLIAGAEPGAIVIDASATPFLERRFELRRFDRGPTRSTSDECRLLGIDPTGYGLGGRALSPFVGRRDQQEALRDALAQATRAVGRTVGIVGDPGAGKSRLVYEFRAALDGARSVWLEGRCASYGQGVPYLPLVEILRSGIGVTEGDAPEVVVTQLEGALRHAGMDAAQCTPYLLELLGIPSDLAAPHALSPEVVRARTFEALRRFVLGYGQGRPTVVVVEDLHWADRASEAFLSSLVDALARSPVLLLATYRPGYQPSWSERSYATQLALPPLAPDESLTLVDAIAEGSPLSPAARRAIVDRADGNPFHLEELAWAAVAGGGVLPPTVADTVRDVLLARMDALPADTRSVLDTAAVLGRQFSTSLLEAVSDATLDLRAHLRELERREFVYEKSAGGERVHVFKHALTQEVADANLPPERRRRVHAAAARALEVQHAGRLNEAYDRLAHHWSEAGDDRRAIDYLSRQAERAMRTFALDESMAAVDRALDHASRLPDGAARDTAIVELVASQALALLLLGRLDEARARLLTERERAERVTDARVAAVYHAWLARAIYQRGDVDGGAVTARRAMAYATASGDPFTLGAANFELSMQSFWAGAFAEGIEHGRQAMTALAGKTDSFAHVFIAAQAAWMISMNASASGDFTLARDAAEQALAIGVSSANRRVQSFAVRSVAWIDTMLGAPDRAVEGCRRALELATDEFSRGLALGWLGHALSERRDHAEGIARLAPVVDTFRKMPFPQYEGWMSAWLADALLGEGRVDEASAAATQAIALGAATAFPYGEALGHLARGRAALAAGDAGTARQHVDRALALLAAIGARYDLARAEGVARQIASS